MNPVYKYLSILLFFILCVPVIGAINYVFLKNSHEFEAIDNVVRMQFQNGGLYLPAQHHTIFPYKLALYHKIKPKIMVMGSSRSNRFRARYFNVPFLNLGNTTYSFKLGEIILRGLAVSHKPDMILLCIDPLWFLTGHKGSFEGFNHKINGTEFQLDMVFMPSQWLLAGKVSFPKFFKILMGQKVNPFPTIGTLATVNGAGFCRDGSKYDYGRILGFDHYCGNGFNEEREMISRGEGLFTYGRAINQESWGEFLSLLDLAKSLDIQVITLLLPLPARVIEWMSERGEKYAYIDEARAKIPAASPRHFDFFDPREFGSSDCEFYDGCHSGEITDLRMLRVMGRDPASGLGPYLNWQRIEATIRQYHGKTMVPLHSYGPEYKEIDFLRMGCNKN
jgi:hypothetical protein